MLIKTRHVGAYNARFSESHEGWLKYVPYKIGPSTREISNNILIANEKRSFYEYYTVNSERFAGTLFTRNFVKMKPSRNGENTLSFTDIGKSCPSRILLTSQIYLLTLFTKIKFSRIFLNLQYWIEFVVLII